MTKKPKYKYGASASHAKHDVPGYLDKHGELHWSYASLKEHDFESFKKLNLYCGKLIYRAKRNKEDIEIYIYKLKLTKKSFDEGYYYALPKTGPMKVYRSLRKRVYKTAQIPKKKCKTAQNSKMGFKIEPRKTPSIHIKLTESGIKCLCQDIKEIFHVNNQKEDRRFVQVLESKFQKELVDSLYNQTKYRKPDWLLKNGIVFCVPTKFAGLPNARLFVPPYYFIGRAK